MKKTITITDPMQVKVGDKAYCKDCDFGFAVTDMATDDEHRHVAVYNPLTGISSWMYLSRFDHATREVEEPEWPKPSDSELHIYLGSDGAKYLYLPMCEGDSTPWKSLPYLEGDSWMSAEGMTERYQAALPLTELKLVPKEEES
jgi:hypothetical protein